MEYEYLEIFSLALSLIIFALLTQIDWATMDASTLNAYRQMRRLQVPPAFGSAFNQRVLCRVGVSRRSPTMARHADRRKISKEQLALAVKKDFNDAMVNEPEAITTFLYSIRNQGIVHSPYTSPETDLWYQTKASGCISHLEKANITNVGIQLRLDP